MLDKHRIGQLASLEKVHAGLRAHLEAAAAAETPSEAPPITVALDEAGGAPLPAALREALETPGRSVLLPGIGRVVEITPTWETLAEILACEQVSSVQLSVRHGLHQGDRDVEENSAEAEAEPGRENHPNISREA